MAEMILLTYTANINFRSEEKGVCVNCISEWNDDAVDAMPPKAFGAFEENTMRDILLLVNVFVSGIERIFSADRADELIRGNLFDLTVCMENDECRLAFAETFLQNLLDIADEEEKKMVVFHYETCRDFAKSIERRFNLMCKIIRKKQQ